MRSLLVVFIFMIFHGPLKDRIQRLSSGAQICTSVSKKNEKPEKTLWPRDAAKSPYTDHVDYINIQSPLPWPRELWWTSSEDLRTHLRTLSDPLSDPPSDPLRSESL